VSVADVAKRLIIGRKLRSSQQGETLLPKRIALPVFASDALSSVAYSPDEIFLVLGAAGLSAYAFTWKVGIAVALVMAVVVASYRQNVQAYTSGGGDYEVASSNLGSTTGLAVGSALLVDYVLTVAVSISSAAQYAASAVEGLRGHQVLVAVFAVLFLTAVNLRGIRESGTAFAIPTYLFIAAILGMSAWGFLRLAVGDLPRAESAGFDLVVHDDFVGGLGSAAFAFLLLRAFASGCAALTGVEAISNGVPAFRKPKGRNAATTLLMLGTVAVTMAMSIIVLANQMGVRFVQDPASDLRLPDGGAIPDDYHQDPVIGQLAGGIFDDFHAGFLLVAAATGVILVLAANTAYNGFPILGSILARDGYLPRQLDTRGDRLAFSNGILVLAGAAILLIVSFDAEVTRLIQLYIVGVFVAFTASQLGMVRHWNQLLAVERDAVTRSRMRRSRAINAVGLSVTGLVLVVVLVTKFTHGAWIAITAMAATFFVMKGIHRHYARVNEELEIDEYDGMLPSRVHAIVLVSRLHKPALRALAYARATRPNTLEAISVNVDEEQTRRLVEEWEQRQIPVPLKMLSSPYRETTRPLVRYVRGIRRESPRDIVAVYIPEYVVGHWWEQLLHNQTALRLKGVLLFTPGVMVTSVPYQLESSEAVRLRAEHADVAAGDVRRGPSPAEPSRAMDRPTGPAAAAPGDRSGDRPGDGSAVQADSPDRGPGSTVPGGEGIPLKPGALTTSQRRRRRRRWGS
jgi:amino acid transporter